MAKPGDLGYQEYLTLDYSRLVAPLCAAVGELRNQRAELKLQVVCNPVMVGGKEVRKECLVSDSRDCTSHWMISDTGLVNLITKGCQPIISASS